MQSSKQSPSDSVASTLISTAKTYLTVFETLDPGVLTPILSPNYTHEFAPASLNIQPRNAVSFSAHITTISAVLKSFPVRAKQIWPNPYLNQVTIWADSETVFHEHVKDNDDAEEWRYRGEYIFMLTMDDQGKVERVLEFLDSDGSKRLLGLIIRARAKLGVGGGDGITSKA